MAQTHDGAVKIFCNRNGISVEEYERKRSSGLKWCTACKSWQPVDNFNIDRHRYDGLTSKCRGCSRVKVKKERKLSKRGMNSMEKTKIEYCQSTWNPVTGCYHTCSYCYARGTANRFKGCDIAPDGYTDRNVMVLTERLKVTGNDGVQRNASYPYGFVPTLHEYRLNDPSTKGFGKTVFVCSMADLFGEWVPDEWIKKVFDACKAAEGHRYLFLTKNPARYLRLRESGLLPIDENFWYGTTATDDKTPVAWAKDLNTFVSIEPILGPFDSGNVAKEMEHINWFIIGAETGNRKDKVVPKREWIEGIVNYAKESGKPVFMKDSLKPIWGDDIFTQYPWK